MTKLLPDFVLLHAGELTGLPRASRALPSIIEHVEIAHPARYFLGRILLTSPSSRGPPTDRTDAVSVRSSVHFLLLLSWVLSVSGLWGDISSCGRTKWGREEGREGRGWKPEGGESGRRT